MQSRRRRRDAPSDEDSDDDDSDAISNLYDVGTDRQSTHRRSRGIVSLETGDFFEPEPSQSLEPELSPPGAVRAATSSSSGDASWTTRLDRDFVQHQQRMAAHGRDDSVQGDIERAGRPQRKGLEPTVPLRETLPLPESHAVRSAGSAAAPSLATNTRSKPKTYRRRERQTAASAVQRYMRKHNLPPSQETETSSKPAAPAARRPTATSLASAQAAVAAVMAPTDRRKATAADTVPLATVASHKARKTTPRGTDSVHVQLLEWETPRRSNSAHDPASPVSAGRPLSTALSTRSGLQAMRSGSIVPRSRATDPPPDLDKLWGGSGRPLSRPAEHDSVPVSNLSEEKSSSLSRSHSIPVVRPPSAVITPHAAHSNKSSSSSSSAAAPEVSRSEHSKDEDSEEQQSSVYRPSARVPDRETQQASRSRMHRSKSGVGIGRGGGGDDSDALSPSTGQSMLGRLDVLDDDAEASAEENNTYGGGLGGMKTTRQGASRPARHTSPESEVHSARGQSEPVASRHPEAAELLSALQEALPLVQCPSGEQTAPRPPRSTRKQRMETLAGWGVPGAKGRAPDASSTRIVRGVPGRGMRSLTEVVAVGRAGQPQLGERGGGLLQPPVTATTASKIATAIAQASSSSRRVSGGFAVLSKTKNAAADASGTVDLRNVVPKPAWVVRAARQAAANDSTSKSGAPVTGIKAALEAVELDAAGADSRSFESGLFGHSPTSQLSSKELRDAEAMAAAARRSGLDDSTIAFTATAQPTMATTPRPSRVRLVGQLSRVRRQALRDRDAVRYPKTHSASASTSGSAQAGGGLDESGPSWIHVLVSQSNVGLTHVRATTRVVASSFSQSDCSAEQPPHPSATPDSSAVERCHPGFAKAGDELVLLFRVSDWHSCVGIIPFEDGTVELKVFAPFLSIKTEPKPVICAESFAMMT